MYTDMRNIDKHGIINLCNLRSMFNAPLIKCPAIAESIFAMKTSV